MRLLLRSLLCVPVFLMISSELFAQDSSKHLFSDTALTTFHAQLTAITQWHGAFRAKYSGINSLNPNPESATSVTSTLFAGIRLWHGVGLYFDPELAGGQGLSGVTGIAGFPNGETPRIGNPSPTITIARAYLQQFIALSGAGTEHLSDGLNQLALNAPVDRLTITIGKYALTDIFDNNSYSHDPRTQFENWALMDDGAWDYPANTHGYTFALTLDVKYGDWSLRAATSAEPTEANGETLAYNSNSHAETVELEHRHSLGEEKGVIRLLAFNNTAPMGNYDEAVDNPAFDTNIVLTQEFTRNKYGFSLDAEQALSENIGAFLRAGWSDGRNESWAFTEIDRSVSLGVVFSGAMWHRASDVLGIAGVVNGLSSDHERYLAAGGYAFIIGDGRLNYAPESIVEAYYLIAITDTFALTADVQFVANPAYNADRGPVTIVGARGHLQL